MYVIGRKPVLELLQSEKPVSRLFVLMGAQGKIIGQIIGAAKKRGVRIDRVPSERERKVLGTGNHQGVMAEISPVPIYRLEQFLAGEIGGDYGTLLVLDRVTDPHHLGAVARTALAAGCDALLVSSRRSVSVTEVAIKASAGALLRLPVIVTGNLPSALRDLTKEDWWVYGAAGREGKSIWSFDWPEKTVIVLGSEGEGLSRLVRERCDTLVHIPLTDDMESLSVSVAASVILFDIARKRLFRNT